MVNVLLLESQLTGPLLVTSVTFYNLLPLVPGIRRATPYWRMSGAVPQNSHLIYSRKDSATNTAPVRRLDSPQVWRQPQSSCMLCWVQERGMPRCVRRTSFPFSTWSLSLALITHCRLLLWFIKPRLRYDAMPEKSQRKFWKSWGGNVKASFCGGLSLCACIDAKFLKTLAFLNSPQFFLTGKKYFMKCSVWGTSWRSKRVHNTIQTEREATNYYTRSLEFSP